MSDLQQGYLTPLRVENLDACNWIILERFGWRGSKDDEFWVEAGETTDFATVPGWSQSIIPRTGTWTKAAVLHDKMCKLLNEWYEAVKAWEFDFLDWKINRENRLAPVKPEPPVFSSIDTDAIFRKNARDEGTNVIRAELLWFGVRSGALANKARRPGFIRTLPRYFADLVVLLALLVAVIAGISWAWPW